jgi:MFS family permease
VTTAEARRSARLLGISWGVSWAGVPISAAFGSVIILTMTGNLALTGVAYFLTYLGSLLAAYPAGHLMDRYGRKPILIAGHLVAATGFAMGTVAILLDLFPLFLASQLIASMGTAATFLTRLAAADLYPPKERGRGLGRLVSYLVFGASASVVLVVLARRIEPTPGPAFLALAWALIPILSVIAAFVISRVDPDPKVTALELQAMEPTPVVSHTAPAAALAWNVLLPTAAVMLFAQATMASMMSVTGAALTHEGHGPDFIVGTLTLHIIGMFGFSPLVGVLGDRFGPRSLLIGSAVYLAIATFITFMLPLGNALVVALIAVGIGWSFAFIGANTIIANTVPLARRGRVLGGIDVAIAVVGAGASLTAGWALDTGGIERVGAVSLALAIGVVAAAAIAHLARPRVVAPPLPAAQDVGK